jgi:phage/plasmid primase-like uncharacterized protein
MPVSFIQGVGEMPDAVAEPQTEKVEKPDGETPEGENATPEQLKAQLEETKKQLSAVNRESADRRKKLEAYEKAKADQDKANMTEVERLKAEKAEADNKLKELEREKRTLILQGQFEKVAKSINVTFVDEQARTDAFGYVDLEKVEDDGKGLKEQLQLINKTRPYLFKALEAPDTDATSKGRGNSTLNEEEIIKRKRRDYAPL